MSQLSHEQSQNYWGSRGSFHSSDVSESIRQAKAFMTPEVYHSLKIYRLHNRINHHAFLKERGRNPLEVEMEILKRI